MESLKERLNTAQKALFSLHEAALINEPTAMERDALLHRFKIVFEVMWKTEKSYLQVIEGIDAALPKSVIRHCREIGLINEEQTETIITMADDRNLTVHTYDEALAEKWQSEFVPMMGYYRFGMVR
ncbi:MAG: nucleotidyltransferase substrate binding protein like protein [Neobacillus sp.]|jgi:nucleotidyltransferase substrate binding protein (TIGR01987 family)|nr:nucleotidyltransferase substrate binding protein like protein [Neobacillus sp.]